MKTTTFKIKEGEHYSKPWRLGLLFGKHEVKAEFVPNVSWLYSFDDEDDYDINKIFGLSRGDHRKNSARLGWNPSPDGKQIEFWCYVRTNGKMHVPLTPLGIVNPRTIVNASITDYGDSYIFSIQTRKFKRTQQVRVDGKRSWFRYRLWPYFGGNKPAPHEVKVPLKIIQ